MKITLKILSLLLLCCSVSYAQDQLRDSLENERHILFRYVENHFTGCVENGGSMQILFNTTHISSPNSPRFEGKYKIRLQMLKDSLIARLDVDFQDRFPEEGTKDAQELLMLDYCILTGKEKVSLSFLYKGKFNSFVSQDEIGTLSDLPEVKNYLTYRLKKLKEEVIARIEKQRSSEETRKLISEIARIKRIQEKLR